MLWYCDDKRKSLEEKVREAATFYQNKYGAAPTQCYVHPGMLADGASQTVAGVRLRPNRTVIKNHFWLGVGSDE